MRKRLKKKVVWGVLSTGVLATIAYLALHQSQALGHLSGADQSLDSLDLTGTLPPVIDQGSGGSSRAGLRPTLGQSRTSRTARPGMDSRLSRRVTSIREVARKVDPRGIRASQVFSGTEDSRWAVVEPRALGPAVPAASRGQGDRCEIGRLSCGRVKDGGVMLMGTVVETEFGAAPGGQPLARQVNAGVTSKVRRREVAEIHMARPDEDRPVIYFK